MTGSAHVAALLVSLALLGSPAARAEAKFAVDPEAGRLADRGVEEAQ